MSTKKVAAVVILSEDDGGGIWMQIRCPDGTNSGLNLARLTVTSALTESRFVEWAKAQIRNGDDLKQFGI